MEPDPVLEVVRPLLADRGEVRSARVVLDELLIASGRARDAVRQRAQLCLSDLVTDAVELGLGPIELRVGVYRTGRVRIEVERPGVVAWGRLALVAACADDWGLGLDDERSLAWCDVAP
jgi:hypothetical protein